MNWGDDSCWIAMAVFLMLPGGVPAGYEPRARISWDGGSDRLDASEDEPSREEPRTPFPAPRGGRS